MTTLIIVANIMRFAAFLILTCFVLPRTYKEWKKKHVELRKLPLILFTLLSIYAATTLLVITFSLCRVTGCVSPAALDAVGLITATGSLSAAIAWYLIYTQRY